MQEGREFSMINVSLNNGQNYGCSMVCGTIKDSKPAITFISSGFVETVFITEIKSISISVDNWCPRCE